jgi:hypothetical protein
VQSITETDWHFERAIISRDNENLPRAIQQPRAAAAMREMVFDFSVQAGIDTVVQKFR